MSAIIVRTVREDDAEALRAIYNWAAKNTTATMDTDLRTPEQQAAWMKAHNGMPYPALVAETADGGTVVGYASLSPYIARWGYRRTAENSVYVHPDWHGVGVGSALLSALITEGIQREFVTLLALITADNETSLRLHRRHGFVEAGTLKRVGNKFGQWVDVTFLQRFLDDSGGDSDAA